MAEGLIQTSACPDRGGSPEGHLIICDSDPEKLWEEKIWV